MGTDVYLKDESEALIGCAMRVQNEPGYGFHEKPYENALVVEFQRQKIQHTQQPTFDIAYQGVKVGKYVPDLITFGKIIVDTKVIERISDLEVGQMLNYLKITGLKLGYHQFQTPTPPVETHHPLKGSSFKSNH